MKRIFSILLALSMTAAAFPVGAFAQELTATPPEEPVQEEVVLPAQEEPEAEETAFLAASATDFEYEENQEGGITITRYKGDDGEVEIPATIDGKKVTAIGESAFCWCERLTSVTIPKGVTSIGRSAFNWCESLTSITLPDGVTTIGLDAFKDCHSLTSIQIPASVTYIGDPKYPKYGNAIFNGCPVLTIYGTSPSYIETYAKEKNIPFSTGTPAPVPDPIQDTADPDFWYRVNEDGASVTVAKYTGTAAQVTIPNTLGGKPVTALGMNSFYNCLNIKGVTIPEGVTTIGLQAFADCTWLSSVTIPDSVTSIEPYAFSDCHYLTTSITLPDSLTSIGEGAFQCCSLTSITLPDSLTSIGNSAFSGCSGLTSITLPDSLTSVGNGILSSCQSLTSVTFPKGITSIWKSTFSYCSSLTSITIPEGVTTIEPGAFTNCGLTSITLPDSLTSIGEDAFYACTRLASIHIPASVTSIEEYAFIGCIELTIYGFSGSCAETYAKANNIKFVSEGVLPAPVIRPNEDAADLELVELDIPDEAFTQALVSSAPAKDANTAATVADLTAQLQNSQVTVQNAKGEELAADAKVGTGCVLVSGNTRVVLVVLGDVDGDGVSSSSDLLNIRRDLLNVAKLKDAYLKAAQVVSTDSKVASNDLLQVRRYLLNVINSYSK